MLMPLSDVCGHCRRRHRPLTPRSSMSTWATSIRRPVSSGALLANGLMEIILLQQQSCHHKEVEEKEVGGWERVAEHVIQRMPVECFTFFRHLFCHCCLRLMQLDREPFQQSMRGVMLRV